MSISRPQSQHPSTRRRSNTVQSALRTPAPVPIPPLEVGDSKALNVWVHDTKDSAGVIFNHASWPGVLVGDLIRVTMAITEGSSTTGFLFTVKADDASQRYGLQISVPNPIAERFRVRNNGEVTVTKVDKLRHRADYIELAFQDLYLGRNEMWRLSEHLAGQCVFVNQEISFIGSIAAKVSAIYNNGKKVSAALVDNATKTTYRSLSAKAMIFIQVCRELWEFAGDGERYNEKIVHSFLPALIGRWREAGTNHIVTIVLVSRVYYDQTEIDYAAGPLRRDDEGNWYKDFYKVITDLEVISDWKPTLVSLKDSFWAFQRDILLTHHYHQETVESGQGPPVQARLVGELSFAHDGPVLEALNLALNPTETHYIDRSLSLTGTSTLIITPGTGYYKVNKHLLRLTTTRLLDQGFGVNLVSLAKPPLHQTPIFTFKGVEPELRMERDGKGGPRAMDPLWGGDDRLDDPREKVQFWWEPFWMSVSFWDKQMDLPFRQDRFVARAKMHQIQMLGLLDHDVLSSIEVPYLPEDPSPLPTISPDGVEAHRPLSQLEAEKFDLDTFTLRKAQRAGALSRNSFASSGSGTIMATSWTAGADRRSSGLTSQRNSMVASSGLMSIPPIEESPRRPNLDLPESTSVKTPRPMLLSHDSAGSTDKPGTSPSQSSIRSVSSVRSTSTIVNSKTSGSSSNRSFLKPSWLFNRIRTGLSQPETVNVTASAAISPTAETPPVALPAVLNIEVPKSTQTQTSTSRSPQPVAIKHSSASVRSVQGRTWADESATPTFITRPRYSPINTPPRERDDLAFGGKRRSAVLSNLAYPVLSSSPISPTNPSRARSLTTAAQAALARRWQHMAPHPMFKHEIKWKSMVTPGCLPLTVEHFPTLSEIESAYGVFSYDFIVDPTEISSFMVRPPSNAGLSPDEMRRTCALVVMRGMAAVRLAQGFQFVIAPSDTAEKVEDRIPLRRTSSFVGEDETSTRPAGVADVLKTTDAVYLSMSNEIHRISYTGEVIQVRRYVRRLPPAPPFEYQCLIWPKLGEGYTKLSTSFVSHGLENYGWNRLDMLVSGYEHQFNESLRYWRTRFVVIPTTIPPSTNVGPPGEKLNDEEIRLLGMDKLAELFSKVRWQPRERKAGSVPPVRFLPTDLDPAACVLDENLMAQLDQLHAAGPLRKKIQERYLRDMSLSTIAKAMREEDGVNIKDYKWHGRRYPESFTGWDLVSWLLREFRDVSSREEAAEWGVKLHEQGLFDHCKGTHGFLDGHYYYQLKGEFAVPVTPKTSGWFRATRHISIGEEENFRSGHGTPKAFASPRKTRKRLIFSQSMVIDVDPSKRSDQAESVILHHDIVHNPATVFHFELHWIGTTARCIEDLIHRQWSRTIEKYGLKLVEAYVTPIGDIRDRNAFQSCFPLKLAIAPPVVRDLEQRVPEGTKVREYFECALLRHFGFILDIQAADLYPPSVEVVYSYRRSPFRHTQFVHRSGVAFVQILGGARGFLFLTNRLMVPGRMGAARKNKEPSPAEAAEVIRVAMHELCSDVDALRKFFDDELSQLGNARTPSEEPPLLTI